MTKIRELSVERAEVIGAQKCDVCKTEISERLGILLRTIYNIIEKCNKEELERRVRKRENIPMIFLLPWKKNGTKLTQRHWQVQLIVCLGEQML